MHIDIQIFYFFNHLPHNHFLDTLALGVHYATRGGLVYYPFLGWAIFWGMGKWKLWGRLAAVSMAATYVSTDLILKHLFGRLRPYEVLQNVYFIPPAPHSFSFPSGQTAVAFCFAFVLQQFFPKTKTAAMGWFFAVLVAVDRIYMGHHYFSDVAAGAVAGVAVPLLISLLSRRFFPTGGRA